MKLFVAFAAILALASASYPAVATWTLTELSDAINDPATDPEALPYIQTALNQLMLGLIQGDQQTTITVSIPVTATMTLDEISHAVHDPATSPAVLPYLEDALHELMVAYINDPEVTSIQVHIPAMNVNVWALNQLSEAIQDPATDPELLIYLEHALNVIMEDIFSGQQTTTIAVVTPPGVVATAPAIVDPVIVVPEAPVIPVDPIIVVPEVPVAPEGPIVAPIIVDPVIVAPEAPVVPEPEPAVVAPETVAASPLVQLIVNVNA